MQETVLFVKWEDFDLDTYNIQINIYINDITVYISKMIINVYDK